jgi:hypothetical protein
MPKQRRRAGKRLRRRVNIRELRDKFLIVCEGARTEPLYFESFRVSKQVIVIGAGTNTLGVVQQAIKRQSQDDYDQVWCVFDRDEFPAQNFNAALKLAEEHDIKVAYSNEAFEIWYLLHFHYYNTGISRASYKEKLTECLGLEYKKNDPNMYETLEDKQKDAIRNAEKLLQSYIPHNPEKDNPCTTVHQLVQELNRFAV